MKLIFLHGAPAAGKLTVAKALPRAVPGRLFDNHAAIDVARTVFDFGAPGFWSLVHTVRSSVLDAAATGHLAVIALSYLAQRFAKRRTPEIAARAFSKTLISQSGVPTYRRVSTCPWSVRC
jgi:hypothetical protein